MTQRAPILLCDASYYGTLAAARALGRDGIRVTAVDPSRMSPALWSRHVRRRVKAPRYSDFERFGQWLLRFGDAEPGHVVYPTSDDVSFALGVNEVELRKRFSLYQPDLASLMQILDKGKLVDHARAVGIRCPRDMAPREAKPTSNGSRARLRSS